jgi:hypothetical protein
MKILSFDEDSNSLIVCFASDTTLHQDPEQYRAYAFQPLNMWPDISEPDEIKKRLAVTGVYHAEQQEREEKFVSDPLKIQQYKDMVGSLVSYPLDELIPPPPPEIPLVDQTLSDLIPPDANVIVV